MPLYRLEGILARLGWDVSRSTLCDQMMRCAEVLTPLYDIMCRRVRASFALHADDTPVVLLNPRRTAYAWVYVGDVVNPYTVFDLTAGRQQQFPEKILAGYRGFLHADAYAGYHPLYAAGATHVGCWAHARRGFFEAKDSDPARAHEALARIRLLYTVESDAKSQGLAGSAFRDVFQLGFMLLDLIAQAQDPGVFLDVVEDGLVGHGLVGQRPLFDLVGAKFHPPPPDVPL